MNNGRCLTYEERCLVDRFMAMKYPPIYKTDNTDRILFVELVDFNVCRYLLRKSEIDNKQYDYIMSEYKRYLEQTDISVFDEDTQKHYELIVELMNLFKKYYNMH